MTQPTEPVEVTQADEKLVDTLWRECVQVCGVGCVKPHGHGLELDVKKVAPLLAAHRVAAERAALSHVAKIGDEVNQCLQIIISNAGNIKDDRNGTIMEDCIAIESAVKRAAVAIRKLIPAVPDPQTGEK